jgi:hypothetical protein
MVTLRPTAPGVPAILRWLLALGVAVAAFLAATVPALAGTPPNRLDDNRSAGLTVAGRAAVQAIVSGLCPIACSVDVGGRVQGNPSVFNVFWDDDWNAHNPNSPSKEQINTMVATITGSSYLDHANQYGVHRGSFAGSHEATACGDRPSGQMDFTSLLGYITCEVQLPATHVPYPDSNSTYSIFLPEGATVGGAIGATCKPGESAAFHAWSAAFTIQFEEIFGIPTPIPHIVIQGYPFTVVPASCAISQSGIPIHGVMDGMSELFSHELAEATIDPFPPTGWIDNSKFDINNLPQVFSEGEAADLCQSSGSVPTTPVRMTNGFVVGTYWSNADNACVPFGKSFHLDQTGLPAGVAHTATVNGGTVTLPFDDNFEVGSGVSYSFPTPVNATTAGTRYVTGTPAQSLSISAPVNVTAAYTTQYLLTTGTAPAFLAASDPALTPTDWHDSGQVVTLDTTDPINTGAGDRYRFDHWSGDLLSSLRQPTITMSGPKTATANYALQHQVVFDQTGIPAGVTWHVASVDSPNESTTSDVGPYTTWVDDGGTVSYAYESPVAGAQGVQYVKTSSSPASPFSVNAATTVLATYKTQFRLTVQTSGLGSNLTNVFNGATAIGTASDVAPLGLWIDSGTPLALKVDPNVDGAGGIQYFFQGFTPPPPATMASPFTTTATYKTMDQLIAEAIASGGIFGKGADGIANALTQKFAAVQSSMGSQKYEPALGQLGAFVNLVQAQTGKSITPPLSTTLQLDAMLVYHNALCKGVALGQIGTTAKNKDYKYYADLVSSLGGALLPPC